MIVLDSSFLISFFLSEDSNHQNALTLSEENENETMLLSDIILHETLTVLNYKRNIRFAQEAYDELMANSCIRFFHLTEKERDEILEHFFNQEVKLSFADISVVYLAKKSRASVIAFDGKILNFLKEI